MENNHITTVAPEWDWEYDMLPASAVRTGNTIYLSGQIALNSEGEIVGEGDVIAQAHQCLTNIQSVLERVGGSMTDIVKLVNYFSVELTADVAEEYWKVRKEFFGEHRPASTGVQVQNLIYPNCLIEIEATAVLREGK